LKITFGIPRTVWRFERVDRQHRLAHHIGQRDDGCCHIGRKLILVRANRPPKKDLENVIHEALHAAVWIMSEEWVANTARDITRLLWRDGWRKE